MGKKNQQQKDFNPEAIKWLLPEFPRMSHVPFKPNGTSDDIVADKKILEKIIGSKVCVQEKIDGASCGMTIFDDIGYIRNRKHILNKAYTKIKTPAKSQFLPAWNWLYEHRKNFAILNDLVGEEVSIFGDWCLYQHGTVYDALPDKMICYDVYIPSKRSFVGNVDAINLLRDSGFNTTKIITVDTFNSIEELYELTMTHSNFSKTGQPIEGIVVKVQDESYKMVSEQYASNRYWSEKQGNLQPCWLKS